MEFYGIGHQRKPKRIFRKKEWKLKKKKKQPVKKDVISSQLARNPCISCCFATKLVCADQEKCPWHNGRSAVASQAPLRLSVSSWHRREDVYPRPNVCSGAVQHGNHRRYAYILSVCRWLSSSTGRLRLNLNPLNLARWIDSWPFDKTWKPGWIDSTWVNRFNGRAMNLEWIFFMTPSRARKSFSKASPYFFVWCTMRTGPVYDGDRFNAVRLFRVISEDSAERDSLDESCAFLIEGAHCQP